MTPSNIKSSCSTSRALKQHVIIWLNNTTAEADSSLLLSAEFSFLSLITMWVYFLHSYMHYSLDENSWDGSLKYCTKHKRAKSLTRSQSSPTQLCTTTANIHTLKGSLPSLSMMASGEGMMTLIGNTNFSIGNTTEGADCKLVWILKPRNLFVWIYAISGFIPEILKQSPRNRQPSVEKYLRHIVITVVFQAKRHCWEAVNTTARKKKPNTNPKDEKRAWNILGKLPFQLLWETPRSIKPMTVKEVLFFSN